MHVLFVGDVRPWTRTEQRLDALKGLVSQVSVVPTIVDDGHAPGAQKPSLMDRVARRCGRPLDRAGASRAVREACRLNSIDVLWVEKALALDPAVVASAGARRVFVSEDDMHQRHNQSRGFRTALPHYELVVSTKPRNAGPEGLARLGAKRVLVLPKAFDPRLHAPCELSPAEQAAFGSDVAFVGSWEAPRARSLSALADAGIDVRVWGNGWHGRAVSPRLRVEGRPAHGLDYARVLNAAPIQLSFLRRANADQSTGRSVEVPAAGAFLLTERSPEHLELFVEGAEAEFFESDEELCAKVRQALDDPVHRAHVATAGRARVLRDERTHASCVRRILDALEESR